MHSTALLRHDGAMRRAALCASPLCASLEPCHSRGDVKSLPGTQIHTYIADHVFFVRGYSNCGRCNASQLLFKQCNYELPILTNVVFTRPEISAIAAIIIPSSLSVCTACQLCRSDCVWVEQRISPWPKGYCAIEAVPRAAHCFTAKREIHRSPLAQRRGVDAVSTIRTTFIVTNLHEF